MKRAAILAVVLVVTFAAGYLTSRSRYSVYLEEVAAKVMSEPVKKKELETVDFLKGALAKLRAEYTQTPSPELRTKIDFVTDQLSGVFEEIVSEEAKEARQRCAAAIRTGR